MVSKRLIVLTAIIVLAIVASGLIYALSRPQMQESAAQAMVLRANEIGTGWTGQEGHEYFSYPDENSGLEWVYLYYNDTGNLGIDIHSDFTVFITTEACNQAYEGDNSSYYAYKDAINYTTIPIGDKAIYLESNKPVLEGMGYPACMFMRGNVLCIMWVYPPGPGPFAWQKNVLLDVVQLQLEKIDQYLAQHPGAN